MSNSKFGRNRSEMELILGAGERFCRSDQRMMLLYRLHDLRPRRIHKKLYNSDGEPVFTDQDFVLNLPMGEMVILAQDEDNGSGTANRCYFGKFGSTVDKREDDDDKAKEDDDDADVLPPAPATLDLDDDIDKGYKKKWLVGDCYSEFVDTKRHCQVGRKSSGLCIKDLGSEYGTFVNGIKLDVDVSHALKNGDLISLGFCYEADKPWMLENGQYWIFKIYEVPQSEFEHRKNVATEAMGISVILDTIFSHIDYKTLKACRFVSKLWDEVAKRELRTLSHVSLILFDPSGLYSRSSDRWFLEAQEKLLTLQKIEIRSISFKNKNWDFPTRRLHFLQNILTNNQITGVEVDFEANRKNLISLFKTILACPQLRQVTFCSKLFDQSYDFKEELGTNESVTELIFKKSQSNYPKILQLFPNTRKIELETVAKEFLETGYKEELVGVKVLKISDKRNRNVFTPSDDSSDEKFNFLSKNQSSSILCPLICALTNSLQLVRLEIMDLGDLEFGSAEFRNLLSKFKNSLQYLKLGLCFSECEDSEDVADADADVEFSEMKMLSVFKLEFQNTYNFSPSFVPGFGSELFPRLEMLDVALDKSSKELAVKFVKRSFGSAADFQNGALRQLRFVFPNENLKEQYSQLAESNFRQLFPNCLNFNFGFVRQN